MQLIQRFSTAAAILAAAVVGASSPAWGAGFQINEHGAIETGRAGAVVSTANQPTAVYHNPAGLTRTEGTQFMGGLNLIYPRATYVGRGRPVDATDEVVSQGTETGGVPVPYLFLSHALSKEAVVGIGVYNNYGLKVEWQNADEFVGRTLVQEISLRTFFITPTIALKLSDAVSVAVGVSLVPATFSLTRVVGASDNGQVLFPATGSDAEGSFRAEATAFGVGATAGLQVRLVENLNIGFVFRSAIDLSFEGDGDFTLPEDTPASVAASFPDQTIRGDVTLPHTFSLGIGWQESNWSIEISSQLTLWNSNEELTLEFDTNQPVASTTLPRDWNISPLFRLGGEYKFDFPLSVRLGVGYDVSPIPDSTVDPTLPDNDRLIGSIGLGYDFGTLRVDAAYMALFIMEREVTPEDNNPNFPPASDNDTVIYESNFAHVLSLAIGVAL